jgi:acyl-CoA synthetase (AMP-forming)/AMP-acid ligase II
VPINIRLAPPEMVEQFNDCEAEIVFIDENFWAAVAGEVEKRCPSVKNIVFGTL